VSIDGQSINNFYQIISKVQNSAGVPLHFIYERNGKQTETSVTPMLSPEPTLILGPDLEATGELSRHGMLMVQPLTHRVETNFAGAVREACNLPIATVRGLMGILKRPSTAKSVVGGPGTMVQATSDAVSDGVFGVISVAAMISISVGIFNLLPVHPLDGGQMVVAFAEMLRGGRRLSFQVQNIVGAMGLATVLLLVVCALTLDVSRFRSPQPKPKIISEQKADR
jgi:regulator of sigma E protease